MEEIYDTNDKFDFEKLVLSNPILLNGNYFIRFSINGRSNLYIQPPKCKTRQGIIKAGKKYYSDLMFTNENDQFIRWMENLETHCQKFIYANREKWFEGTMEMHDIENYFTSPMKIFKSGKFYIVRTNINAQLGKPGLKIYDENEKEVEFETITENTDIVTILEFQGIKCSARSFQIEIELKQVMTLKPKNLFEKCIIKTNDGLQHISQVNTQIEDNYEVQQEINLATTCQEEQIDGVSSEETKDIVTEYNPIEEQVSRILETHDIAAVLENEAPPDLEKENVQTIFLETPEIQEVDFNMDELSSTETVQIKKRNEVYYEMYREARRKAKIARDLALSSYLEAKRIKNTYMLDDIKDSDDSDLETEMEKDNALSEI
jgi:hypothetical protein